MADVIAQDKEAGDKLPLSVMRKRFAAWHDNKEAENTEQRLHRKYYHGKQLSAEMLRELNRRKQPPVQANRIKRKIDFLVGMEQRQRRDPKAYPRTPQHQKSADAVTDAVRFVCDNNSWPELASSGAHDGMTSGIGAVKIGVKRINRVLEVDIVHTSIDEFFYDPRSFKPDFSDAAYMGEHKWMDIDDASDFLGIDISRQDLEALGTNDGDLATTREEDKEPNWVDLDKNRLRVIQMYYKRRGIWRLAQFTGNQVFRDVESPYLDEDGSPECPYYPWSPYIDEEGIHYGLVRDMKSPQDEINHRRSKLLHMMSVNQTIGEEGSVKSVDEMKAQKARADGHITVRPNKRFDVIDNSFHAQGQADLLQEAKAEIENLGPNPGLIGRGVEKQSGRAILAQQNSGMTELSPVFERLRMWKLRVYRAIWARIRQFWTEQRWVRVTDSQGDNEFIGINTLALDENQQLTIENQVSQLDLDIILDEGPDVLTIQEEEFEQITSMVQAGLQIPPEMVLELSSLRHKDKILEAMRGNPEAQAQEAAQQKKLLIADVISQIEERQSKTALNEAKTDGERADTAVTVADAVDIREQPQFV